MAGGGGDRVTVTRGGSRVGPRAAFALLEARGPAGQVIVRRPVRPPEGKYSVNWDDALFKAKNIEENFQKEVYYFAIVCLMNYFIVHFLRIPCKHIIVKFYSWNKVH